MTKSTLFRSSILLILALLLILGGNAEAFNQMFVYLPITFPYYCPDYYDDFSNPASEWYVGDDGYARFEYLHGEYRILSKDIFDNHSDAPSCARDNYTVEVDARWVGISGESYGIVFGLTENLDEFYLFEVSPDYQDFALYRFDGYDYLTIIPYTYSPFINNGFSSNQIKITRNRYQITLGVNGIVLGTWTDANIIGETYAGIFSLAYIEDPISDARFDNFSIRSLAPEPPPTSTSTPTPTPTATPSPSPTPTPIVYIVGFNPSTNPQNDFVTIKSDTQTTVDMTGWLLKAENQSGRYDFPIGFSLGSGQSVNVRSGVGTNTITNLYMGLPFSLWTVSNNCAYLRDYDDNLVDKQCVN